MGRDRGKCWLRSGDHLEIRICLRDTEHIVYPERGLCLRRQGLGFTGLKFSSSEYVRTKTAKIPFSFSFLSPHFPSSKSEG